MVKFLESNLNQHIQLLTIIDSDHYCKPSVVLSSSTIGQHTRHLLEAFLSLETAYPLGRLNYGLRKRNPLYETSPQSALMELERLKNALDLPDKELIIEFDFASNHGILNTGYHRELFYAIEHSIHHQALIKAALVEFKLNIVPDTFGVAPSTLKYRA